MLHTLCKKNHMSVHFSREGVNTKITFLPSNKKTRHVFLIIVLVVFILMLCLYQGQWHHIPPQLLQDKTWLLVSCSCRFLSHVVCSSRAVTSNSSPATRTRQNMSCQSLIVPWISFSCHKAAARWASLSRRWYQTTTHKINTKTWHINNMVNIMYWEC